MKIGDSVNYKNTSYYNEFARPVNGVIMSTQGRKWVKVGWSNQLITKEHVNDLRVINENR